MDQLKPGDIICYYNKWNPISWLIRKIQHCRWSHVSWVYNDQFVLESVKDGVKFSLLSKLNLKDTNHYKVVRVQGGFLTEQQMKEAVLIAGATLLGSKYDYFALFRLLWVWMWKMRHTSPADGSPTRFYCSEQIAQILFKKYQFQFRDDVVWENTVPKDISESKKVVTLSFEDAPDAKK